MLELSHNGTIFSTSAPSGCWTAGCMSLFVLVWWVSQRSRQIRANGVPKIRSECSNILSSAHWIRSAGSCSAELASSSCAGDGDSAKEIQRPSCFHRSKDIMFWETATQSCLLIFLSVCPSCCTWLHNLSRPSAVPVACKLVNSSIASHSSNSPALFGFSHMCDNSTGYNTTISSHPSIPYKHGAQFKGAYINQIMGWARLCVCELGSIQQSSESVDFVHCEELSKFRSLIHICFTRQTQRWRFASSHLSPLMSFACIFQQNYLAHHLELHYPERKNVCATVPLFHRSYW